MTGTDLEDGADRGLIRNQLDQTIVVEAAAGTGKTTELVERIINVVATGVARVDQVVAVTFTEKAAGELKLRIRKELESKRQSTGDIVRKGRLSDAIARLEEAHVSTIHGFCADLLRERPVEAGIDPRFEVLSEGRAAQMYAEAFHRWISGQLEQPPEGVRRALRRSVWSRDGRDDADGPIDRLAGAGRELVEWRDFTGPWGRAPFDRDRALADVVACVHELADLSKSATSPRDVLFQDTAPVRALSEDIRTEERLGAIDRDAWEARAIDLAQNTAFRRVRRGRDLAYGPGVTRASVWAAYEAVAAELGRFQYAADADLAALLHGELQGAVAEYTALKRRAGALDYVDLLICARDLLLQHDHVRHAFQSRFTHLFVDEFQDTDPLQAEILLLLAADDPAERDWRSVESVPGKLFIVGDPKQAIYRFRRADVETYQQVCDQLVAGGAIRAYLRTSFRSTPAIQHVVNAAFSVAMTGDRETLQAQYVALSPHRPDAEQPSVVVLPVPEPYGARRVAGYAIEASLPGAVGAFIHWLLTESGWTVTERTTRDELPMAVPVQPRHVCILFRRFLHYGQDVTRPYVEALEARGVRHLLVGGKSFHGREEVETLRVALAAIEWPDDELSVFATIRGALFAVGDEALLEYRHAHGGLHPFRVPRQTTTELRPIADALTLLGRLHRRRNDVPIAETITQLLEATRAHVGFVLRPAGEQALANVLHVAELARQYEANGGMSFRGFVEELREQSDGGQAAEAPILEEGSDGVRLMTVHKAKGLEFPVVILADMTAKLRSERADRLIDKENHACYLRLGRWTPIELAVAEAREVARDEAEGVRVAYVAATRARDLLVIPGVGDVAWEGGWTSPLTTAIYPQVSSRRSSTQAPRCPPFKKDSVWKRPDNDPSTPATVAPGLHMMPSDGAAFPVVWWDPHALDLDVGPPRSLRHESLIAKDVPEAVVASGLREYETWQTTREQTIARGQRPSVGVQAATEWAAMPEAGSAPTRETASPAPVQPNLFQEGGDDQAPSDLPASDDEAVTIVDARGPGAAGGARFGELVHALLATVPLAGGRPDIEALAEVHARVLAATPEESAAAADTVERVLTHELLDRARAADARGRCRREAPVTLTMVDGTLVEGIVDLAFEHQDGWTVVDYKTDREISDTGERHYRRQVGLYVSAIRRATGAAVDGILVRV